MSTTARVRRASRTARVSTRESETRILDDHTPVGLRSTRDASLAPVVTEVASRTVCPGTVSALRLLGGRDVLVRSDRAERIGHLGTAVVTVDDEVLDAGKRRD